MVPRLPFRFELVDGLNWARFIAYEYPPVREHWPGLYDADLLLDAPQTPSDALAVDNNNREEVALYLGLVWTLLHGHTVLALPHFHVKDVQRHLGRPGAIVKWGYEVDTEGGPGHYNIRGFKPARSSVPIRPQPTDAERAMGKKGMLFQLQSFTEVVAVVKALLCDAQANGRFFGTTPSRSDRLLAALNAQEPPDLASLLGGNDLFVSLTIGVDLGNNDAFLIASHEPIEERLRPLLDRAEAAIRHYESSVSKYWSVEEAIRAMTVLAGSPE